MARTIVTYKGKDVIDMYYAIQDAEKEMGRQFSEAQDTFLKTGISGTAGQGLKLPLDQSAELMKEIESKMAETEARIEEQVKVDRAAKEALDTIYQRPIKL